MNKDCHTKLKRSDMAFIVAYTDLLSENVGEKIFVSDICKKAGYTTMCFSKITRIKTPCQDL